MSGRPGPLAAGPTGGPKVVAVGGGHGLAATLRAARSYAGEITAVVSVADNGGSSGRLKDASPRAAPGDLRKCLVALVADTSPLSRAMEHRFDAGDLDGHAFGNLLIAAMEDSEGDLVTALDEIGRLLGTVGRVLPTTTTPVELEADVGTGTVVSGQVEVGSHENVLSVSLQPDDVPACAEAVAALLDADQIVIGPGSLFTSVLAALAVEGIRDAVVESRARMVYVCNLLPQDPETAGFDVADHVDALVHHGVKPHVVLYDRATMGGAEAVPDAISVALARPSGKAHDAALLGAALARCL